MTANNENYLPNKSLMKSKISSQFRTLHISKSYGNLMLSNDNMKITQIFISFSKACCLLLVFNTVMYADTFLKHTCPVPCSWQGQGNLWYKAAMCSWYTTWYCHVFTFATSVRSVCLFYTGHTTGHWEADTCFIKSFKIYGCERLFKWQQYEH